MRLVANIKLMWKGENSQIHNLPETWPEEGFRRKCDSYVKKSWVEYLNRLQDGATKSVNTPASSLLELRFYANRFKVEKILFGP